MRLRAEGVGASGPMMARRLASLSSGTPSSVSPTPRAWRPPQLRHSIHAHEQRVDDELPAPHPHRSDLAAADPLRHRGDRHSRYFTDDAYAAAAEPKEIHVVPGAGHVDLYDKSDLIPFDKFVEFFTTNLD